MSNADPQFPKMNLTSASVHLSSDLADLVVGDHPLPKDMPHELRVQRIFALIQVYKAVIELGIFEHTGDWDWRITLDVLDDTVGGPVKVGTTYDDPDCEKDSWSDSISLDYEVEPSDYANGFERWHDLTIEVWPTNDSDDPYNRLIAIDRITNIHITYD